MSDDSLVRPVSVDAPDGTYRAEFAGLTVSDGTECARLTLSPGTGSATEITVPANRFDSPQPFEDAIYTVRIANGLAQSIKRIRSTTD